MIYHGSVINNRGQKVSEMDVFITLLFAIGVLSLIGVLLCLFGILGLLLHWAIRAWSGETEERNR